MRACSRSDGLVHPPVVGRLLGRRPRVDGRDRPEHLAPPRVDRVPERAGVERIPLGPGHGPRVADQLAGELAGAVGQELGRLDLLRHDRRLGLGAGPRLVVRRERQEDDETEQHGESGGQHAEDARGAVTVAEVAALGRPPAHEEHRRDGDRGDDDRGEEAEKDVHRLPFLLVGSARQPLRMRSFCCSNSQCGQHPRVLERGEVLELGQLGVHVDGRCGAATAEALRTAAAVAAAAPALLLWSASGWPGGGRRCWTRGWPYPR